MSSPRAAMSVASRIECACDLKLIAKNVHYDESRQSWQPTDRGSLGAGVAQAVSEVGMWASRVAREAALICGFHLLMIRTQVCVPGIAEENDKDRHPTAELLTG